MRKSIWKSKQTPWTTSTEVAFAHPLEAGFQ